MKYKIELEINKPRDEMLVLFQDVEFMKKWQPGFRSLEVLDGQPGEVGSKSKLTYLSKGKPSEIIETIILKELPDRFDFLYEAKNVKNWARNSFVAKGEKTLWIAEHEFKFSSFMKLFGLMQGMFVKQTTKDMNTFKQAAEAKV
ncbi:MAG: SRPBCC family protein [Bacillota bacterium]|nr:SRPBCC family protein [Bacillota bacterium]